MRRLGFTRRAGAGGAWVTLLWYAPVAAYLMLASVYARRAPMLKAVLPPLVLALAENIVLGTSDVLHLVWSRLTWISDPAAALASMQLWLGLVLTAVLLVAVTRLRRYRDET